jgi:hypothetical protein
MDIILGWTLDAATAQDARDAITGQHETIQMLRG